MTQTKTKTKQGAAAIYTVVFFCLLIGIVAIGFVSIMIQDIISSTNYDLSQSAYDAALAGIEDAKVLLLQYSTCNSSESRITGCPDIIKKVNEKNSSNDCDLIRNTLGRKSGDGENETLVRSINKDTGAGNNAINSLGENIDMAYTCVKLSLAADDYLGTLTETSDVKVIPLRTGGNGDNTYNGAGDDGDSGDDFDRIRIQWFSREDWTNADVQEGGYPSLPESSYYTTSKMRANNESKSHSFAEKSTLPPPIRVSLIQTDPEFKFSDFETLTDNRDMGTVGTDYGTLFLRPIKAENPGDVSAANNHIASTRGTGFSGSTYARSSNYTNTAINPVNSPVDIKCLDNELREGDGGDLPYSCVADLDVPPTLKGIPGSGVQSVGEKNKNTSFLVVSSLYAKPETSFSVQLLKCDDESCNNVKFVGVQSVVDATGRANDVFRRIEARVELQDVGFPYFKYGLNAYGNGEGQGEIFKNYWATKNCWSMENGTAKTCSDYSAIEGGGNF